MEEKQLKNNKGSRLIVSLTASGVLALGLTAQANADSLFAQAAPRFSYEVQQKLDLREIWRRLVAGFRRNPQHHDNSPSQGDGRNVPELSAEVGGAAVVLLIGGLLVLTSRRKRHKESSPS